MKMKKIIINIVAIFAVLLMVNCQADDFSFGDLTAPSSLKVTANITGKTTGSPNGDGTGKVTFTTIAKDAISYKYIFPDGTSSTGTSGVATKTFVKTGVNTYDISVVAYGKGGSTTNTAIQVEVLSTFADEQAKNFLTGGAGVSKKWYWAADKAGNIGLGPNTVKTNNGHTFPDYFSASPWLSDKLCMYEAEFVFTQSSDGQNITFQQLKQIAYVPGTYAPSIGVTGDICHGTAVAPSLIGIKKVNFSPSTSIATLDGVNPKYRGTTMNFTDGGFMCWYVGAGSSKLEIIEITDTTLKVRIEESADFAWYCYFQTEKPVR
jgi:hypothetical protein